MTKRCPLIPGDTQPHAAKGSPRIRLPRLVERLNAMAKIGATPAGGASRLALTRDDYKGRALFLRWCRALGFAISADAIGNLFVLRPGTDPHRLVAQ